MLLLLLSFSISYCVETSFNVVACDPNVQAMLPTSAHGPHCTLSAGKPWQSGNAHLDVQRQWRLTQAFRAITCMLSHACYHIRFW